MLRKIVPAKTVEKQVVTLMKNIKKKYKYYQIIFYIAVILCFNHFTSTSKITSGEKKR